jgi:hypothetical protein
MEVKIQVEGTSLTDSDFKKINLNEIIQKLIKKRKIYY